MTRRRPRHPARLPRRALEDRPGAAGAAPPTRSRPCGRTVSFSRGLFGRAAEPGAHREGAARPVAVGQAQRQDHDAVGRHEAARDDRQGARRTSRRSCSSTSRPPASTSSCAATCGRWCGGLRDSGVTIILTTHYIDEAEEMADRIGVINKGELIVVEEKTTLMKKLGKKQLTLHLQEPLTAIPAGAGRLAAGAEGRRARARVHLRRAATSAPASRRCCGGWASSASGSRTSTRSRARWRTSSSAW